MFHHFNKTCLNNNLLPKYTLEKKKNLLMGIVFANGSGDRMLLDRNKGYKIM